MDELRTLLQQVVRDHNSRQSTRHTKRQLTLKPVHGGVLAGFANGRHQLIVAEHVGDHYVLTSMVMGRRRVNNLGHASILPRVWELNRDTSIVAFSLDKRGRLVGRVEQLAKSLDAREMEFYLEQLARECDRFEYVLTGDDVF